MKVFAVVSLMVVGDQAMMLTLFGKPSVTPRTFNVDGVTQRCYNIYNCFSGQTTSVTWQGAKRNTKLAFYNSPSCQTRHHSIGSGTPEGALYFTDERIAQNVKSFIVWDSGVYATKGVEDACYESVMVNASSASTA